MARYLRLRQGASAAEPEESEGRADAGGPFAERKADDRKNDIRAHGGGGRRARGEAGTERIRCRAESGAGRHDAAEAFVSAGGRRRPPHRAERERRDRARRAAL